MITPENKILHNARIKYYPLSGVRKVTVCSRPIFKESGWELVGEKLFSPKPQSKDNDSRPDSVRRAKQKVFEIAMLNEFTHFITWTLDKREIDRYDVGEISKKLKVFLGNQTRRRNASYIIIPECHKDGAIHMHGLLKGDFDMIDSGKKTSEGQDIYNMPQWKLGFSTAIELDGNTHKIARYITKYVTKDMQKIFGNFYYAGGSIVRNPDISFDDVCYRSVEAKEYYVEAAGASFKYLDIGTPEEGISDQNNMEELETWQRNDQTGKEHFTMTKSGGIGNINLSLALMTMDSPSVRPFMERLNGRQGKRVKICLKN